MYTSFTLFLWRPDVNVALIMVIGLAIFWLGYRFYARYITRVFNEDDSRPTPAVSMEDGVDYVPTRPWVVFGHHFASIAGAGPILGPAIALVYGWVPCLLWIVFGTVIIGGVHDLVALLTSIREKGRSIAELARDVLGPAGFFLLIAYTIVIVLLVCASFLNATATALTSMYPLSDLGLGPGQTIFRTVVEEGVTKGVVGGIASTSVIVITIFAPLIGWLLYKKRMNVLLAVVFAVIVSLGSVFVGIAWPVRLSGEDWKKVLCIYTFIAAGIPVWLLLQPRDFTNSFILYTGIIALVVGGLVAGFRGVPMQLPTATVAQGTLAQGPMWPMLFILIACGAISGFHALVAGGTSAKQICMESHCRPISYGGMVLEGILAMGVIIAIAVGLTNADYMRIMYPAAETGLKQNPILAFAVGMGGLMQKSVGLPMYAGTIFGVVMVEGFIATTLDTAVRLNRYLFEELWRVLMPNPPAILRNYFFNAGLVVVLMYFLAYSNTLKVIWPIFGAGNQLLAVLTLTAVTVWLVKNRKPSWFTIIPAVIMFATTVTALVWLLVTNYIPNKNLSLMVSDILLLVLAVGSVFISIRGILGYIRKPLVPKPATG
jgi:carbon starvation protein